VSYLGRRGGGTNGLHSEEKIDDPAPATLVTLYSMRIQVLATPEIVAERAADWLRTEIARASAQRGRCLVALGGGRTPWRMLRDLRRLRVHWHDLQVFQVDEQVVPENDERRNARQIADLLVAPAMLRAAQFHAMPVERSDLRAGAEEYTRLLSEYGGTPPVLDVVQLGIAADGHTASLLTGDRLLDAHDRDVGITAPYQGVARMTLTLRVLDAARHRLWLVTGADKAAVLRKLWDGDTSVSSGRVVRESAFVFADSAAAVELPAEIRSPH
jgi:6-phosphogluconolactonase